MIEGDKNWVLDQSGSPSGRDQERAEMESKVAAFLAGGGTIEKVDSHVCVIREAGKQKGRSSVLRALKNRGMVGQGAPRDQADGSD